MSAQRDDPVFWNSLSVGYCVGCGGSHVLHDGRCWDCRQAANNSPRGEVSGGAA